MTDFVIKICGVTTPGDAALAISFGATAIGVNFWPGSQRFVDDVRAKEILAVVPPHVLKVGVFVNSSPAEVAARVDALALDKAQLHGNELPHSFTSLDNARLIRAVRVSDVGTFSVEAAWRPSLWLYDAHAVGYGGSGVQAPWDLIARFGKRPFLLAGGLTPDNVQTAIGATLPMGVDVASGVESSPGHKDPIRLRRFIEEAQAGARKL
jgi:phosphoribosylanthranilate isomerase